MACSHQVFATAELLEAILLRLPIRDAILAQRLCTAWRNAITSSAKLQRALFLRPARENSSTTNRPITDTVHHMSLSNTCHQVLTTSGTRVIFTSLLPIEKETITPLVNSYKLTSGDFLLPLPQDKTGTLQKKKEKEKEKQKMFLSQPPRETELFFFNSTTPVTTTTSTNEHGSIITLPLLLPPASSDQQMMMKFFPVFTFFTSSSASEEEGGSEGEGSEEEGSEGEAKEKTKATISSGKQFHLDAIQLEQVGGVTTETFLQGLKYGEEIFSQAKLKGREFRVGWCSGGDGGDHDDDDDGKGGGGGGVARTVWSFWREIKDVQVEKLEALRGDGEGEGEGEESDDDGVDDDEKQIVGG